MQVLDTLVKENYFQLSSTESINVNMLIHQLFEEQVKRHPNAIALKHLEQKMTYQELNQKANQLAHYLEFCGIGPEQIVAIALERSLEMIISILAILKAGAAYLPLDPSYPNTRLQFMLEDSQAILLISHSSLVTSFSYYTGKIISLDKEQANIAEYPVTNPNNLCKQSNLAYIIYTSGSTGKPKGVLIEHRGLANQAITMAKMFGIKSESRVLQFASLSFDASVSEINSALIQGACLVIPAPDKKLIGNELQDKIINHRITNITLPPSILSTLDVDKIDSLESVVVAGESGTDNLFRKWNKKVRLINAYGPTEATVCATMRCYSEDASARNIGLPIPNIQVYVLDENKKPSPIGVTGELYIGGIGIARAYLNLPELTKEKFIVNPFATEEEKKNGWTRLYRTGDLVKSLPSGELEYIGRVDGQIKLRGHRIELGEIENILNMEADVLDSIVIFREDMPGLKQLIAYLVLKIGVLNDDKADEKREEIRKHLEQQLPDYMVPNIFVFLSEFPLTTNGKIDRKALPIPNGIMRTSNKLYILPSTDLECQLANYYSTLLNIENIGMHDNFFRLGGDSLLASQLMSQIRSDLRINIPLKVFFEQPTPGELANYILQAQLELDTSSSIIPPQVHQKDSIPLSFAQQQLYLANQLINKAAYNCVEGFRLRGDLEVGALKNAFQKTIERHTILRTSFREVNGTISQVISSLSIFPFIETNLNGYATEKQNEKIQKIVEEENFHEFDIKVAPLIRINLVHLSPKNYILLINLHHIIIDLWSMKIFLQELKMWYNHLAFQKTLDLPELPIQYSDFAIWQNQQQRGSEKLAHQLEYWQNQLQDAPESLHLPIDRPRASIFSYKGDRLTKTISYDLANDLRNLAGCQNVTLFMILLAAFQVLLHRYSNQDDIVLGIPVANRPNAILEKVMGYFVNILAIRSYFKENLSFEELLKQTYKTTLEAHANSEAPFELIVENLKILRQSGKNPIFQVMFAFQNKALVAETLQDTEFAPFAQNLSASVFNKKTSHVLFDLTFEIKEISDGSLELNIEYATDLFEVVTIERMIRHFVQLLKEIARKPKENIERFSILPPEEKKLLSDNTKISISDLPKKLAFQLFEEQVKNNPEAIALAHLGHKMTYQELNQKANQLAHYLESCGIGSEQIVAIALERSLEMIISILAILKAGAAYLPLDPNYPNTRLQFMLKDSQAVLLISHSSLASSFSYYTGKTIILDERQTEIVEYPITNPHKLLKTSNLAYIIYTSGSTGSPKGVLVEHQGMANLVIEQSRMFGIMAQSRVLQFASLSFDASVSEIFCALTKGACLVIPAPDEKLIGKELEDMIISQRITNITLPPSILSTLDIEKIDSLESVVVAGESGSDNLFRKWNKKVRLINAYGPTEATVCATMHCYSEDVNSRNIGFPLTNVQVYILDKNKMSTPIGVTGELYIGGIGIARAYLNLPELTKEKFIVNPFATEEEKKNGWTRLYKTGDLARYLPNGEIEYIGRVDGQIKLRGHHIELGEIENLLIRQANVKDAIVLLNNDERLIAYIVHQQSFLTDDEKKQMIIKLREALVIELPDFMIPAAFVLLNTWPLTLNNKINRKALPMPNKIAFTSASYKAPCTEIEKQLAIIWEKVLQISKIGIYDNFFELGGNSLLIIRLSSEVKEMMGLNIPPRYFYETPTIKTLSERIFELMHTKNNQFVQTIDFSKEVYLDRDITANQNETINIENPQYILLTGATGYLGAFLLNELLEKTTAKKIYCLVRGDNQEHAQKRFQKNLENYSLTLHRDINRIVALVGDVSQPCLGINENTYQQLAETVDTIYHCAAEVNFLKSYTALKPTNIMGVQNVLKLATSKKVKAVHYISTAAVFGLLSYFKDVKIHKEDDPLSESAPYLHLDLGYTQSKWVAEQIIWLGKSRSIPITVFRTGFLLCHGQSGAANTSDFWSRFVHGCINMGCFPDLNIKEELIQAEYAIQAIIHISKQPQSIGNAFHIVPRQEANISIAEFFDKVNTSGFSLQKLPYNEWKERAIEYIKQTPESPIAGLQPFFTEIVHDNCSLLELYKNSPAIDDRNTQQSLRGTGIQPEEITSEVLDKYLSYLKSIGYL